MNCSIRTSPMVWAALYALAAPLCLGLLALWEPLKANSHLAEWVQAIGSVAAIIAGFLLAANQANAAARRKLSALAGVLDLALKLIEEAIRREAAGGPDWRRYLDTFAPSNIDRARDILTAVPLHDAHSADIVVAIHNTIETLTMMRAELLNRQSLYMSVDYPARGGFDDAARISREVRETLTAAWFEVGGL